MILVPDSAVPLEPALLTLREFEEGRALGLYDPARGDALIEWYESMGWRTQSGLLGRVWFWRGGEHALHHGINLHPDWRVLVLWYAKPERLH